MEVATAILQCGVCGTTISVSFLSSMSTKSRWDSVSYLPREHHTTLCRVFLSQVSTKSRWDSVSYLSRVFAVPPSVFSLSSVASHRCRLYADVRTTL